MRLDKFLKVSRIIKRRTVASDACSASRVLLNGKQAKPAARVKTGDVITVCFAQKEHSFKVICIDEKEAKKLSIDMAEEI